MCLIRYTTANDQDTEGRRVERLALQPPRGSSPVYAHARYLPFLKADGVGVEPTRRHETA